MSSSQRKIVLYARFIDSITGELIGQPSEVFDLTDDEFSWRSPPAETDTKAILEFSYNKIDWHHILDTGKNYSYLYYNAPTVV